MSVMLISVSCDTVVSNKHEERTRHYYVNFQQGVDFASLSLTLPVDWRDGMLKEGCVHLWVFLHVWRQDLHMLAQVNQERIPGPSALDFDDVERNLAQEVFQGGPNPYAMSFQWCDSSVAHGGV